MLDFMEIRDMCKSIVLKALLIVYHTIFLVPMRSVAMPVDSDTHSFVSIFDRFFEDNKEHDISIYIPKKYKLTSSGRVSGVNIFIWLPDYSTLSDRKNAPFGADCGGYCNGRTMISITNDSNFLISGNSNYAEMLFKSDHKRFASVAGLDIKEISATGIYNSGFTVRTLEDRSGLQDELKNLSAEEFLYHFSVNPKDLNLEVECSPLQVFPSCSVKFSLKCPRSILVRIVALPYEQRQLYLEIAEKVASFVSEMLPFSNC